MDRLFEAFATPSQLERIASVAGDNVNVGVWYVLLCRDAVFLNDGEAIKSVGGFDAEPLRRMDSDDSETLRAELTELGVLS